MTSAALSSAPSALKAQVSALLSSSTNQSSAVQSAPAHAAQPLTDLSIDNLRAVVEANHAKVSDLFRAWDEDRNGKVTKKEFRRGLVALDFEATVDQMNNLFDLLDTDGSGTIEYKELHTAVKSPTRQASAGQLGSIVRRDQSKQLLQTQKSLRAEQDEKQTAIALLGEQQRVLEDSVSEHQRTLEVKQAEHQRTLEVKQAELTEKERTVAELTRASERAERALSESRAQATELQELSVQLREQLQTEVEAREREEARSIAVEEAAREAAREAANKAEQERETLTEAITAAQRRIGQWERRVMQLEAAEMEKSKQLGEMESQLKQREEQLKQKEEQLKGKDEELKGLRLQLQAEQKERQEAEAQIRATKEAEERVQAKLQQTEALLRESEARVEATRAEMVSLQKLNEQQQRQQREQAIQQAAQREQEHVQATKQQQQAHEEAAERWAEERAELMTKAQHLEAEIERRNAHDARRDALAAAILSSATDDKQRDDDFKFWQARKLPWRRASSYASEHEEGSGDATGRRSDDATARLAATIGSEIGSQIGNRLVDSLSASKGALTAPRSIEAFDGYVPLPCGSSGSAATPSLPTSPNMYQHHACQLPPSQHSMSTPIMHHTMGFQHPTLPSPIPYAREQV